MVHDLTQFALRTGLKWHHVRGGGAGHPDSAQTGGQESSSSSISGITWSGPSGSPQRSLRRGQCQRPSQECSFLSRGTASHFHSSHCTIICLDNNINMRTQTHINLAFQHSTFNTYATILISSRQVVCVSMFYQIFLLFQIIFI